MGICSDFFFFLTAILLHIALGISSISSNNMFRTSGSLALCLIRGVFKLFTKKKNYTTVFYKVGGGMIAGWDLHYGNVGFSRIFFVSLFVFVKAVSSLEQVPLIRC